MISKATKFAAACLVVFLFAAPSAAAEPNYEDTVTMEITADPPSVYPTQRLTVTLSVWVKALPDELADRNPMSVQRTPPMLQIPWVDDQKLPEGLVPVETAGEWLTRLHDSDGEGFGINHLASRPSIDDLFDSFNSSLFSDIRRPELAFQPRPRHVTREGPDGHKIDYWLYQFKRSFVARQAGDYSFGPVTLDGDFAVGDIRDGQLAGKRIRVRAPALVVEIKQVPEAGRPASYLGAIGDFTWSAEVTPRKCRVGDPVTLTLTLRGHGSLDAAAPLDLSQIPAVAERFKTYEGTRDLQGDTCQFTYTLRPLSDKVTEFPSIPGSFFDVTTDSYVTDRTHPIPITVEKASTLSDRQIVAPSGAARRLDDIQVQHEGVFANITDPNQLRNQAVHPEYWLVGIAGLAGLYVVVAAAVWYARRRAADPAQVRRRAAVARARHRLHEGTALLRSNQTREGAEQIRGALVGLMADVADRPASGMTSAEACRQLRHLGAEPELVGRLSHSLEACDAARYAAGHDDTVNGLATEAHALFDSVVHTLKKQKCLR